MKVLPILASDSYKQFHFKMYVEHLFKLYSNMTPRSSRMKSNKAVWFGLQYYIKEYLINQWNELFFKRPLEDVIKEYKRFHKGFSFTDIETKHIEDLHKLGYLPLKIKALPEGALVPMKVPFYTITNTHPDHAWLVNFLETQMSTVIWDLTTVSTISYQYRQLLNKWAVETTGSTEKVQWQGHDFSMRGRSSMESTYNQAGHLLSFTGTDTIPAVMMLEEYYNANMDKELIGSSVPATEHSVMTSYGKEDELVSLRRLLKQFPKGILSVVADSWDLWKLVSQHLPALKEEILAREGTLVMRPDSGDPVEIICGIAIEEIGVNHELTIEQAKRIMVDRLEEEVRNDTPHGECGDTTATGIFKWNGSYYEVTIAIDWNRYDKQYYFIEETKVTAFGSIELTPAQKGVIELLWDIFGGTTNELGYKVLDSHIGAIYGDSITLERADAICARLKAKGFASTNVVFGIGSYTFNMNTRDSLGIAVKSTYCEVGHPVSKIRINADGSTIGLVDDGYAGGEFPLTGPIDSVNSEKVGVQEIEDGPIFVVEEREIFKDPITDDGTKKSAKGLLRIEQDANGDYVMFDQQTKEQEEQGCLELVFEDGELIVDHSLADIRARVEKNLQPKPKLTVA